MLPLPGSWRTSRQLPMLSRMDWMKSRTSRLRLWAALAAAMLVSAVAQAATLTVVNTNTSGAGSLAQAITDANNTPGADEIVFNITSPGTKKISVLNFLPSVTDPVTIDGTTQPGFAGAPLVELVGANSNSVFGLLCTSSSNTIRGLALSGFNTAVYFYGGSSSNRLEGCWIGLDASGNVRANSQGVIVESGKFNTIGGTNQSQRNVVVGSIYSGIYVYQAWSNIIAGNYIGLMPSGTNAVGNGWRDNDSWNDASGIFLESSSSNLIGGTVAGARNIISGNPQGVRFTTRAGANIVQGNWFGLDASGAAKPTGTKQLTGVLVMNDSNGNIIGGTTPGAGNVLSGQAGAPPFSQFDGYGIRAFGSGLLRIQGNYIGTDATGSMPIGNLADGIHLDSVSRTNTIGGTTAAARNVIAASGRYGIYLSQADETMVQGNFIGTSNGTNAMGNGASGIYLTGSQRVQIGGTTLAAANTIAFNGTNGALEFRDGVTLQDTFDGPPAVSNPIRRNSIFSNGDKGIRLTAYACSGCGDLNDLNDADFGPNRIQNFPVLTNAVTSAGTLTLNGRLHSEPNQAYTIEFFASPEMDPSGFGEGKKYIGQFGILTDGSGNNEFEAFFVDAGYSGQFITATATDSAGDTSQFGNAVVTDYPGGVLQFRVAAVNVNESSTSMNIEVVRINGDNSTVSVQYSTSNGTATAGLDYVATNGTVTFAGGVSSALFQVNILNDSFNEPNETFQITLHSPSAGAVLGGQSTLTLTIVDDDPIFLYARDAGVTKPASGSATLVFPIELSQASTRTVSVNFATTDITAMAGTDYEATNGSLVLLPGVTNVSVAVTVFADGLQEGSKSFALTLSGLLNATMGDSQGLGTIYDGTQGVLQFSAATYSGLESATGAVITVTRTGGALGNVSVPFTARAGTATAGTDFIATNGILTFNNGVTSRSFTVPLLNDASPESSETVLLALGNPTGTTLGSPNAATLTVTDDDSAPALSIRAINDAVVLSWPTQAAGFTLVSSPSVTATNWPALSNTPVAQGSMYVVTNAATSSNQFYRLRQ